MALALSRVGGQVDLLKEVAGLFLDDFPRSLQQIHQALGTRDAETLAHHAHNLKGSVCNFGAPEIVNLASELERKARATDWSGADTLVAGLTAGLDQLRLELEALRNLP